MKYVLAALSLTVAMSDAVLAAERLRVLTYNVWGLPGSLLKKPERFPALTRVTPLLDADIIGFQETFHSATHSLSRLPGYPHVARGSEDNPLRFSSGLLLVSKWPILRVRTLTYTQCAGWDCFSQKGALFARVQAPGGEVDVYVTHLNASGADSIRTSQIQELAKFMSDNSPRGPYARPVILLGDFNFQPRTLQHNRVYQLMGANDAHRDYTRANPRLPQIAADGFTADPRRNFNKRGDVSAPKRIDFVFYRSSERTSLAVQKTTLAFDAPVDGMHLSDHFGVLADFHVK